MIFFIYFKQEFKRVSLSATALSIVRIGTLFLSYADRAARIIFVEQCCNLFWRWVLSQSSLLIILTAQAFNFVEFLISAVEAGRLITWLFEPFASKICPVQNQSKPRKFQHFGSLPTKPSRSSCFDGRHPQLFVSGPDRQGWRRGEVAAFEFLPPKKPTYD